MNCSSGAIGAPHAPHIAFFIVHLGVGGAQKIASFVMNRLVEAGYRVSVICYWRTEEKVSLCSEIERSFLFVGEGESKMLGAFSKLAEKAHVVSGIAGEIRRLRPDCAVAFGPDPFMAPALRLAGFSGKLVCCERGYLFARNPAYQLMLKWLMSHADVSVFQFDEAKAPYGSSIASAVRVIPNVCCSAKSVWRGATDANNVIVGAGRLVEDKGFATLVKAVSLLRDKCVQLVIYGDGPDRARLEELVYELELTGRVSLPGAIDSFAEEATRAKLFVLASQYEGLPNTLIEVMCSGIPVVVTDCAPGGARFLTRSGAIGGPIVPVGNPEAMAEAIEMMLDNPEKAAEFGGGGKVLTEDYSEEKIAVQWLDLFSEVLETKIEK